MKKLLFICMAAAMLFSCKKENFFSKKNNGGLSRYTGSPVALTSSEQIDRTVLVVLISTLSSPNMRTEAEARNAVFGNTGRTLRTYYNEVSGNRLFIAGKTDRLQGDVTSITVADPLLLDPCSTDTWRTLALPALTLKLINPASYNTVIYITPMSTCSSNGIGTSGTPGGPNTGYYAVYFDKNASLPLRIQTLSHEVGHNLGLLHANTRTCKDAAGLPVTLSDNSIINSGDDPNDVMGAEIRAEVSYGRLFNAPHLKSLGWLSETQITTTNSTGTFAIAPLYGEHASPRALVVPAFIPGYDLWIETRQQYGQFDQYDLSVTHVNGTITETAIGTLWFRLVKPDPQNNNKPTTELLDMHPATINYWGFMDAGLKLGETFSYGGKNFKLESVAPDGTATVKITVDPATFIPYGGVWKYLDNGSDQGTAWKNSSYSDGTWASGPSELGYGEGDEATVISYGPNASAKYITTYFRKTINISNPLQYSSIFGNVKRDDGVAIYVNGVEVFRDHLAAGAIYTTRATTAADNGDDPQHFTISPTLFVPGNNVIAVEIHQSSPSSSDVSFNLELKGN